jgi:mannose-6-phosphate isomerase-like protein (cupin superfamily)
MNYLNNKYLYNYHPVYLNRQPSIIDNGPNPLVINIEKASMENDNYRTTIWTGNHMQLTLMSLNIGEDIGLEMHPDHDQFIRIEDGEGIVSMGNRMDNFTLQERVNKDYAFIIPAGTWHNLTNTGSRPLKLYSLYAPSEHSKGTIHKTKMDAMKRTTYF